LTYNLILLGVSFFVFLNLIIITASVYKLRFAEVNFLSCYILWRQVLKIIFGVSQKSFSTKIRYVSCTKPTVFGWKRFCDRWPEASWLAASLDAASILVGGLLLASSLDNCRLLTSSLVGGRLLSARLSPIPAAPSALSMLLLLALSAFWGGGLSPLSSTTNLLIFCK